MLQGLFNEGYIQGVILNCFGMGIQAAIHHRASGSAILPDRIHAPLSCGNKNPQVRYRLGQRIHAFDPLLYPETNDPEQDYDNPSCQSQQIPKIVHQHLFIRK